MLEVLKNLWETSGIATMSWQQGVMILVSFILFYLAIKKQYEPLLLLPIAFGMLLTNLPGPAAESSTPSGSRATSTGQH